MRGSWDQFKGFGDSLPPIVSKVSAHIKYQFPGCPRTVKPAAPLYFVLPGSVSAVSAERPPKL